MKYLVALMGVWWVLAAAAYAQMPENAAPPEPVVEDMAQDNVPEEELESGIEQQPALEIPHVAVSRGGYGKVAVLQGLNKVTARISEIIAPVGEVVSFGNLHIRVDKCWRSNPTEEPESIALLEIFDHKPDEVPQRVFKGWMFASSPSVSDLQHPVYDVIVLRCEVKDAQKGN